MTLADNPRYAAYTAVHGLDHDAMRIADNKNWPGGNMCGFILWNRARLVEYSRVNREAFFMGQIMDHAAYDAWLAELPVGHGVPV